MDRLGRIDLTITKKLGDAITGSKEKYPLEQRLMNFVSFVCIIATALITISNIVLKLSFSITIQTTIALFLFLIIYYKIRIKKNYRYFGIQLMIILTILIMSYIFNWGTYGSILYYFLFFLAIIPIYQNKKFKRYLYVGAFAFLSLLFFIEYYYPQFIFFTFENERQRLLDIFYAMYIMSLFLLFYINTLIRNYRYEREKVIQQNIKIEQLMKQEKKEHTSRINFFTNISHELRSPLSLIKAPLEMLMEEDKDMLRNTKYKLIYENAKKMGHLVDQVLDFRKLEQGSLKLLTTPLEITEFIKNITQSYSAMVERDKIKLEFSSNIPKTFVKIDKEKMSRALSNIIDNAFKFTSKGGSIDIALHESKAKGKIRIIIEDTGIGIPEEILQNIFEPFYQSPDTKYGTGLGLSITREIIKLHQGNIEVESVKGKGSCFIVEIPIELNQNIANIETSEILLKNEYELEEKTQLAQSSVTEKNVNKHTIAKSTKILIVEDNNGIIDFLSETFNKFYEVFTAPNGKIGLAMAEKKMPDLIISDIMMPEMDGLELCEQIKTKETTSHIPVLLLTAKSSDEDKIEGLETGADDYIRKPFNMMELKVRAENLILSRKKLRERYVKELFSITPDELAHTSADKRFLQRALQAAKTNLHNADFGVSEFVSLLGMSRSSLHNKLKQLTDQSASQFLLTLRLKRAAEIIESEDKPISEVCYEVGMNNLAYFSKKFKELFGKLPSEY